LVGKGYDKEQAEKAVTSIKGKKTLEGALVLLKENKTESIEKKTKFQEKASRATFRRKSSQFQKSKSRGNITQNTTVRKKEAYL